MIDDNDNGWQRWQTATTTDGNYDDWEDDERRLWRSTTTMDNNYDDWWWFCRVIRICELCNDGVQKWNWKDFLLSCELLRSGFYFLVTHLRGRNCDVVFYHQTTIVVHSNSQQSSFYNFILFGYLESDCCKFFFQHSFLSMELQFVGRWRKTQVPLSHIAVL
jgi:hypothetical protein